jgi:hypothetical protein
LASSDPADLDIVSEVYTFLGQDNPTIPPNTASREQAERLLRGIRVDK